MGLITFFAIIIYRGLLQPWFIFMKAVLQIITDIFTNSLNRDNFHISFRCSANNILLMVEAFRSKLFTGRWWAYVNSPLNRNHVRLTRPLKDGSCFLFGTKNPLLKSRSAVKVLSSFCFYSKGRKCGKLITRFSHKTKRKKLEKKRCLFLIEDFVWTNLLERMKTTVN